MPASELTEETCRVCNRRHGGGYQPVHPFVPIGGVVGPLNGTQNASGGTEEEPEVVVQRFPFDPVLRQALITKGVITIDDLRNAEAMIQAVTGQFLAEGGQS